MTASILLRPCRSGLLPSTVLAVALLAPAASVASDIRPPGRDYFAYVCAESEDVVYLVRFGPAGFDIVEEIEVGSFPAEIEGPHGINVSPSGDAWYVSIAHGQPFGTIHKYTTGDDEWQGDVRVGMFPATLDIAASTGLLYVVNSDFYGDHTPSSISVVETSTMTEVAQIPTGTMPHGSRLSDDGSRLYSVNMMDDELVEVDAHRFEIRRRLALASPEDADTDADADGGHHGHGEGEGGAMSAPTVEPSWVSRPTADGRLYVAALSGDQVLEIDLQEWEVARRFETPSGPYNVAVDPDGELLVVTYKKSQSVGFWDLGTGEEVARIDTTRRIPHGVVITPDGRYSMVTVEGVGGEPGVVEVFDNDALQRIASLEIGKQAGGIAVWEPATLR